MPADGNEQGTAYLDMGSGPNMPSSSEWHAYDGRYGRPPCHGPARKLLGRWRGAAEYPLDWAALPADQPLYESDVDLSGSIADCEAHLSVIRDGGSAGAQAPPARRAPSGSVGARVCPSQGQGADLKRNARLSIPGGLAH